LPLAGPRLEFAVGPGTDALGAHDDHNDDGNDRSRPQASLPLAAAAALLLALNAAAPAAGCCSRSPRHRRTNASPDTSAWTCSQCPFFQGYDGNVEVGALAADGANASYGRYTGIDRSTVYADAGSDGQWRSSDGSYANYDLERLGLASRDGTVEGGREGRYDLRLSYDGQPGGGYDNAVTPFRNNGGRLVLPADWVAAGSTAGMSALGASLAPVNFGYDRRTVALLGRYFASPAWTLFGEFRRQEKNGTEADSASFLTEALQFVQPIDYVTNSFDGGIAWAGSKASLRLTYTDSWFEDHSDSFSFANPYAPLVTGSTEGRLAMAPNNTLQQFAATGNAQLPWFAATLSYAASIGRLLQNSAFLPVSTLPGATVPAPGSLDGDVRLSHYAIGLAQGRYRGSICAATPPTTAATTRPRRSRLTMW
jgi:hypothetical protein